MFIAHVMNLLMLSAEPAHHGHDCVWVRAITSQGEKQKQRKYQKHTYFSPQGRRHVVEILDTVHGKDFPVGNNKFGVGCWNLGDLGVGKRSCVASSLVESVEKKKQK